MDQFNKQNTDALILNRDSTYELIDAYTELAKRREAGTNFNAEDEKEYLDVQNTLAEVFPALIQSIDSTGQAHLKNGDALQKEIESTEKLIEAQNRLTLANATEEFEKLRTSIDGGALSSVSNYFFGNLEDQIKNTELAIASLSKQGLDTSEYDIKLINLQREFESASAQIKEQIFNIITAIADLDGVEIDSNLSDSIEDFVNSLDLSNLNEEELNTFANSVGNLQVKLQQAADAGDASSFNYYAGQISNLAKQTNDYNEELDKLNLTYDEFVELVGKGNGFIDTSADEFGQGAESIEAYAKTIQDLSESISKLESVEERLLGVSNAHVEASSELLYSYNNLTNQLGNLGDEELRSLLNKKNLTTEEQSLVNSLRERQGVIGQLNVLYPQYAKLQENQINLTEKQIEAIQREEKANKVLLEAYKLSKEGKLSEEQDKTVIAAQGTKNRIEILKREVVALNEVLNEYKKQIQETFTSGNIADIDLVGYTAAETLASSTASNLANELDNLANFSGTIDNFVTKINESSSAKSKDTKASKVSNSTTKESIYLTDKYKQQLEALNLEIEKQQAIQAQNNDYSATYRKSLQDQIKLERQKLNLINSQSTSLNKQIQSGRIAQTGNVTLQDNTANKSNIKSGTTKSVRNGTISGFEGRITDTYGTVRDIRNGRSHTGIDIAGARGARLESNVNGRVIKSGYNELSGNHVQILDEDGIKHFYGHLDTIVAKLGDVVEVGTKIGTIGSTGNSTGSHLHYEIKNAQGKNIDPIEYVNAAKQSQAITQTVTQNVSSVISTTAQSIDDAKSTLNSLQSDALKSQETIAKLEQAIIESQLGAFEFKRSEYDSILSFEEAKLKNVTQGTDRYTKTLQKQQDLLNAKQRVNNEELAYIDGLIKKGGLSNITLDELKSRTLDLKTSIQILNNEIGRLALDKIYVQYDNYIKKQDDVLNFENNKIAELDRNSNRYVATLDKIINHQNRKHVTNLQEIDDLQKLINSGTVQGELLTETRDKIQELTLAYQQLNQEISDTNFEIIVSIKGTSDEQVDDLTDSISISQKIQALYTEGSIEATSEINKQVESYNRLAQIHDTTRRALQAELNQRNLLPERIKEITELLEDETSAYYDAVTASKALTESIAEQIKQSREEIANKVVQAYKDAQQEIQDDHMRSLDKQVEAEDKAHERRIKQLTDEMDLYRSFIEERLRLIDKEEAERDFNMELEELTTERSRVQDQINLLSLDNSQEAKSRRKKLQEDLDKIDKDISEKRHDRDIELQKENLNTLLEDKEIEIEGREELENERHDQVITDIDREREYWSKHYTDLLNDERKFAQLRADIVAGNFDKIQGEFDTYIADLKATLPDLEDTLDGTMKAVGTSIRQNVIDNLRIALDEINELTNLQSKVPDFVYTDDFNPNASKDNTYSGNTSSSNNSALPPNGTSSNGDPSSNNDGYASINRGDLQVLLGKYLSDIIAPSYSASSTDRTALKDEGKRLAALGRNNNSQIPVSSSFSTELTKFTPSQVEQLKSFARSNAENILGGKYKSKINNIASLNTGGLIKRLGSGIDGKGGGLSIVHPNEVVETPYDVDQLVNHSNILDRIMSRIAPLINNIPSLNLPQVQSAGDVYEINFNVENMNGTQQEVNSFVNRFAERIRTTKGGFGK